MQNDRASAFFSILCMFLLSQQYLAVTAAEGGGALAPPVAPQRAMPPLPTSLDLGSTVTSQLAPNAGAVQIQTGGTAGSTGAVGGGTLMTVAPGQPLTPAQYMAVSQAIFTGRQGILMNSQGAATGGFATVMAAAASAHSIETMVVPKNVMLGAIGFAAQNPLNTVGSGYIAGTLSMLQTAANVASVLNFGNLTVAPGGVITTSLPADASFMGPGVFESASLNINVAHNVLNQGSIVNQNGALNITAGGTVTNQGVGLPTTTGSLSGVSNGSILARSINVATASGTILNTGLMYSINNLRLINTQQSDSAFNVLNSGKLASKNGDVVISSTTAGHVNIDNSGGTIEAENGSLNVRDSSFTPKSHVDLNGGDLLTQSTNIESGTGIVRVNVGEINGPININAGEAHVTAATKALYLGRMNLSGDPTFYNTLGSVVISTPLSFPSQDLAIVASTDIITAAGAGVITTAKGPPGGGYGNITLVAGANFNVGPAAPAGSNDTTTTLTITGPNYTGGKIDLNTGTAITSLSTAGTGGSITLIAFGGSGSGAGSINLPSAVSVTTGGGLSGSFIATAGGPNGLSIGSVDTSGTSFGGGGTISISTASPSVSSSSGVTILNGAITSAARFGVGAVVSAPLHAGALTTNNGGNISVSSGSSARIVSIDATRTSGTGSAGTVTVSVTSPQPFVIDSTATTNGVGFIRADNGSGITGSAISVTNNGSGGIRLGNAANLSAIANSDSGTHITLDAAPGTTGGGLLVLPAGTIAVDGGANFGSGGDGGTLTLRGSMIAITGGGPLLLTANASKGKPGGTVTVTTTSSVGDISIGGGAGQIQIQARGAASGGNGGTVNISSGRQLNITPNSLNLNASPQAGNSRGAFYSFHAAGNLFIDGSLSADAAGTGYGGSIILTSSSSLPFEISASAAGNGVTGVLSVVGSGNVAPVLSITNNGTGGITVGSMSNLVLTTLSGRGGQLTLSAGASAAQSGILSLPAGTISVDAVGSGFGGTITLRGQRLVTGGLVTLHASGAASAAGAINITTFGAGGDFAVDGTQLSIIAQGIGAGGGGNVTLSSGRHLLVDTNYLVVNPLGPSIYGNLSFTSGSAVPGNLLINGTLNVSGNGGFADGGQVVLSSNSPTAFKIGAGATVNGVNGSLIAESASTGGTGGTVKVTANGGGGITLSSFADLSATSFGGAGGVISLNAAGTVPGALQLPGGTISVDAVGVSAKNGGKITLTGTTISHEGHLTLSANAIGAGNGGSVSVITTSAGSDLSVGFGSGEISISATGGTTGVAGGNGGAAIVSAGRHLTVNPLAILIGPQGTSGRGARYDLAAGSATGGNLFISGSLDASAAGTAAAFSIDSIKLTSNSTIPFDISATATVNGVTGTLSAKGGPTGGNAGQVTILNNGGGGISLGTAASINVSATSGAGGGITLDAANQTAGPLNLPGGETLSADASGATTFNGGLISLRGLTLNVSPSGTPITLSANGRVGGRGGNVSVTTLGATSDIMVDNAGQISISATAGAAGGGLAAGGTVTVSAGRNLTINTDNLLYSPNGGAGASLTLIAGTNTTGCLLINGSLDTASPAASAGGSIVVQSNSASTFVVGGATSNGITGSLNAHVSGVAGAGGQIQVINNGGGITVVSLTNIVFAPGSTAGAGGSLLLNAVDGPLTLPGGTLSSSPTGNNAAGAGNLTLRGTDLLVTGPVPQLALSANGSLSTNGGIITVALSGFADLTVGAGGQIASISTTGGSLFSKAGNAGTVSLSAGRNVTIDTAALNYGALGFAGEGAQLSFTAGSATNGNLFINGALDTSGVGAANGNAITLTSNSSVAFTTGAGAFTNGVNGTLKTDGGRISGSAGKITIQNNGIGGITIGALSDLSAVATSGQSNGISLIAYNTAVNNGGRITIPAGTLSVDAGGSDNFNGGGIAIRGLEIAITGGSLMLSANATGNGNGGSVTVQSFGISSDLAVGNGSGQLIISAKGGASGSWAGNGGSVLVQATRDVSINPTFLTAGPSGLNGNGSSIQLLAGSLNGSVNGNLSITGTLSADGIGAGNGGSIILTVSTLHVLGTLSASGVGIGSAGSISIVYDDPNELVVGSSGTTYVTGDLRADAQYGNGGAINISNKVSLGINLTLLGTISADSIHGMQGTITFAQPGQSVTVAGSGYLVGVVDANGSNVIIAPGGASEILQVGTVTATSGNATLSATGANGFVTVKTLLSATGNTSIIADTFDYTNGLVQAGGSAVLKPASAVGINLGSSVVAPGFNVTLNELANTTATKLVVGDADLGGGVFVVSDIDVSGPGSAGVFDLEFNNAGSYNSTARTITLGTHSLTINVGTTIDSGTITGTNSSALSLVAGSALTISGPVLGNTLSLVGTNVTTTSGATVSGSTVTINTTTGSIALGAAVTGTTSIEFKSFGNITSAAIAQLTTPLLILTTSGSIASSGTPAITSAGALTINAGVDAFITDTMAVQLGASTIAGQLQLTAPVSITTTGNVTAGTATLTTSILNNAAPFVIAAIGTSATVTVQSPNTASLTLLGGGMMIATDAIIITSATNNIAFTGPQTLTAPNTTVNSVNGTTQLVSPNQVAVNGNLTINTFNFLGNPADFMVSGTKTITIAGGGTGGGTIANPNGDLVLTSGMLINTGGKSLVLIARGDILTSGVGVINLSSPTGRGGSLGVLAGFDFSPALGTTPDHTTVFTVTGASSIGGSINLNNVLIMTSSFAPAAAATSGGNVLMVANAGTESAGVIMTGGISTNSLNNAGGKVTVYAPGGVQINGSINTSGATSGGKVIISGAGASIVDTIPILNGLMPPDPQFFSAGPISGSGAGVAINGSIITSSTNGDGGSVTVSSDAALVIGPGPGIVTTGQTTAGAVTLSSLLSSVKVGGPINTSGKIVYLPSSSAAGGTGGAVTITAPSSISVSGSINTDGTGQRRSGR